MRADPFTFEDTIIAVSTPLGFGGLGVVRLSGRRALECAQKIFKPSRVGKIVGRTIVFGHLLDFEKNEFFDEGYLFFSPAPHSYTRENVVEISCHGSPVVLEEIVRLGIKAGARQAHPGEFTLRAYANGRIDLLQAEAVNDLIRTVSLQAAKISFRQLEGGLSRKMQAFRAGIIGLLSQIEATIEFPEESFSVSPKKISRDLKCLLGDVRRLAESYDVGRAITEGLTIAIVGRANVGKSTLFNALLEMDRAIVSPYPGTTRDYLREKIRIRDACFQIIDMAGLEQAFHPLEAEGIKRGKTLAQQADGIIFLFDLSRKETAEDLALFDDFNDKKSVLVFNKSDLSPKMDVNRVKKTSGGIPAVLVSALKKKNLIRLKDLIYRNFVPPHKESEDLILHLREKMALEEIAIGLEKGLNLVDQGYSEDVYIEEIRKIVPFIGHLTGEIRSDDVIDDIFSRFCVGK